VAYTRVCGTKKGVMKMFEEIIIFEKKSDEYSFLDYHTFGWKFKYKDNQYGNFISNRKGTGRYYYDVWKDDDGNEHEERCEYYKIVELEPKHQILILEKMLETMKRLTNE